MSNTLVRRFVTSSLAVVATLALGAGTASEAWGATSTPTRKSVEWNKTTPDKKSVEWNKTTPTRKSVEWNKTTPTRKSVEWN